MSIIASGSTVLFQGDSITDAGRSRDDFSNLGRGYPHYLQGLIGSARLLDGIEFLNRGISGNRIVDLYARIKSDVINLKPDAISVLIGVNDTWHEFGSQNGVAVPKFERVYRDFLTEVTEALPGVKWVLCEPFVLDCGVVVDGWRDEIDERRAVVAKLAAEFDAKVVEFQGMFDAAVAAGSPPDYWAKDGVHPTPAGHALMAREWAKVVGEGESSKL
jgi:lysophospholipase L1-like esterase